MEYKHLTPLKLMLSFPLVSAKFQSPSNSSPETMQPCNLIATCREVLPSFYNLNIPLHKKAHWKKKVTPCKLPMTNGSRIMTAHVLQTGFQTDLFTLFHYFRLTIIQSLKLCAVKPTEKFSSTLAVSNQSYNPQTSCFI